VNPILIAAPWAVVGGGAGVAVRWVSTRLATTEELESSSGIAVSLGPPVLCMLLFWLFGAAYRSDPIALGVHSAFALVLVQIIFFDLEHALILDRVIYPAAVFALAVSFLKQPWWAGIATGLVTGAFFLLLGAIGSLMARTEALGLGDVKLATCIGLFLGPNQTLEAMVVAFASAGAAAIALAAWRRSLAGRIALGPYLAVGALIAMHPMS
jgi:prepilin signal peptidase PulO-like enzyme (type II secretory pathway)